MEIKFISNTHYRINNGIKSDNNNWGAFRGIIIKPLGNNLFEISIEILEAPFYQFQNNFQMTPKLMKIIRDEPGLVYLRGINEFSDYAIKMNCIEEYIKEITLIMLDRDIEIIYLNAEQRSSNPANIDKIAIKKILEMLISKYDDEERTSSISVRNIINEFNQLITPQEVDKYITLLNRNENRKILIPFRTIKIPEDKRNFSMFSTEYEDAYYTDDSFNYLNSLILKYKD